MNEESKERPLRVGLISLGCAKNLVDAEIMVGTLLKDGVEITNDAADADVVIVNTCSFIDSAQRESIDTILESAEVRETRRRGQGLVVSGCLPQRFRDELPKLLPEVDAFMGIDQVTQVTEIARKALERRKETALAVTPGKASLRRKSAKVSNHLAEVDRGRAGDEHHAQAAIPGEQKSGKKTIIGPPGAAQFQGNSPQEPVLQVNARPQFIPDFSTPRFRLTPKHFAYVKIAEGCNHPCSFCIIPRMRGSHRSRALDDIVQEARALIADGVKELNLISQDSTYYGLDLRPNHSRNIASPERFQAAASGTDIPTLCTLLRELNALPGDFWIRLLYTHPAHWTDELIETIAACPKVAHYVDIPLQHIHHNMLERMRRETSQQYIVDLIRRIRAGIPGIALRTTFIVGFPGETEAYFQTLLDFIRETRFERLGVFTYSKEEGTRASRMEGQIADKIKQQRRNAAMAAQHEVAVSISESFVGRVIGVLVEKQATAQEIKGARISSWEHGLLRGNDAHMDSLRGRYLIARGEADAPDIDGRVYVRGRLPLGEFARVKVVGHTDYDLIAEPA